MTSITFRNFHHLLRLCLVSTQQFMYSDWACFHSQTITIVLCFFIARVQIHLVIVNFISYLLILCIVMQFGVDRAMLSFEISRTVLWSVTTSDRAVLFSDNLSFRFYLQQFKLNLVGDSFLGTFSLSQENYMLGKLD